MRFPSARFTAVKDLPLRARDGHHQRSCCWRPEVVDAGAKGANSSLGASCGFVHRAVASGED
jgi:hypothetical protein